MTGERVGERRVGPLRLQREVSGPRLRVKVVRVVFLVREVEYS